MSCFTFYWHVQGGNEGRLNVWLSPISVTNFEPFILIFLWLGAAFHIIPNYSCSMYFLQRPRNPGCNQATSVPTENATSRIASGTWIIVAYVINHIWLLFSWFSSFFCFVFKLKVIIFANLFLLRYSRQARLKTHRCARWSMTLNF